MSSSTMKVFLVAFLTISSALVVDRSSHFPHIGSSIESYYPPSQIDSVAAAATAATAAATAAAAATKSATEAAAAATKSKPESKPVAAAAPAANAEHSPEFLAKKFAGIEDQWVQQVKNFFHSFQYGDAYGHTGEGHRVREDFRAQCKEGTSKLINLGTPAAVDKYFAPVCEHMQGWHKDLCGKMHGLIVAKMVDDAKGNRLYAQTTAHHVCQDMWWHLLNALKAASKRHDWEEISEREGDQNDDVDRLMQHFRTRQSLEPGTVKAQPIYWHGWSVGL